MSTRNLRRIPLPNSWNKHVRASLLHVISLAQFAVAYTRGWAANSINPRLREKRRFKEFLILILISLALLSRRVSSNRSVIEEPFLVDTNYPCFFRKRRYIETDLELHPGRDIQRRFCGARSMTYFRRLLDVASLCESVPDQRDC